MENEFIGSPKGLHYMDGSETINFQKTFDLNGTQNDEMLRLYLRKAGLSDEIECLTAEQRRAFIYDIIKSNKMPGYWLPSTMQNSNFNTQRSKMQLPPSLNEKRRNVPNSVNLKQKTMHPSSSAGDLKNTTNYIPRRFVSKPTTPQTPPSPSTFVKSVKGARYEISGPINFQHIAGDMTRDMSRNAFDLTPTGNDNVLRKYMMERGISEEDISGMRKADIIRKIVQSKFTWMPPKKDKSPVDKTIPLQKHINYATISGYPDRTKATKKLRAPINTASIIVPPQSPSPNSYIAKSKPEFSNYTLVTSRFADVSQFPPSDNLYGINENSTSTVDVILLPPLPPGTQPPEPPPRKSQHSSASLPTIKKNALLGPQFKATNPNITNLDHRSPYPEHDSYYEVNPIYETSSYQTPSEQSISNMKIQRSSRNITPSSTAQPLSKMGNIPPPPPMPGLTKNQPLPRIQTPNSSSLALPMAGIEAVNSPSKELAENTSGDARDAFLESIRKGVTLKHQITAPNKSNGSIIPPLPPSKAYLETLPSTSSKQQFEPKNVDDNTSIDSRDAFLESIRKGVALKKIDQKAATISGVRPRVAPRPKITDFLTELKMGVTARRIKNPEDNPFTKNEPDEWSE